MHPLGKPAYLLRCKIRREVSRGQPNKRRISRQTPPFSRNNVYYEKGRPGAWDVCAHVKSLIHATGAGSTTSHAVYERVERNNSVSRSGGSKPD